MVLLAASYKCDVVAEVIVHHFFLSAYFVGRTGTWWKGSNLSIFIYFVVCTSVKLFETRSKIEEIYVSTSRYFLDALVSVTMLKFSPRGYLNCITAPAQCSAHPYATDVVLYTYPKKEVPLLVSSFFKIFISLINQKLQMIGKVISG